MSSAVCTLFEKHYYKGVSILVNSLYSCGFRGNVYAGYRGELPSWCKSSIKRNMDFNWEDSVVFEVTNDVRIYFLPLNTDYHLTNYKPDFMLTLLNGPLKDISSLFYFDPDIVVTEKWNVFKNWVECGVALAEDINSPLQENHPNRVAWRKIFGKAGFQLKFKSSSYVNGGFIGLLKTDIDFLIVWKELQEAMAPFIGGLNRSIFILGDELPPEAKGAYSPFSKTDQDALNATIEASIKVVSIIGKEAMAFQEGSVLMPHALGPPKPWQWNFLQQLLLGRRPRRVDKEYWKQGYYPIKAYSRYYIIYRNITISIAAFIGRFYRK